MLPVSDNRFAYVRNEWTAIWTKALPSPKAPLSTTMTCMKLRRNRWPSKRWTTVAKKTSMRPGYRFQQVDGRRHRFCHACRGGAWKGIENAKPEAIAFVDGFMFSRAPHIVGGLYTETESERYRLGVEAKEHSEQVHIPLSEYRNGKVGTLRTKISFDERGADLLLGGFVQC